MEHKNIHSWDLTPKEAVELQKKFADKIIIRKFPACRVKMVAGVDVSVKNNLSKAAIVVLTCPDLRVIEEVTYTAKTRFPYVPGLLSFREAPVILKCVEKLQNKPDVFIFDGQGLAHPRRMGLASHLGLFLQRPTIGSAKSHLYGDFRPPGGKKGNYSLIKDKDGKDIGAVLTTRGGTKPVYVSPGHLMDIPSAVDIVLKCSPKYRLPEPVRQAHRAASLA